jgi:hypothetical protein
MTVHLNAQQQLVTLEMYRYYERNPDHTSDGVASTSTRPFAIKTILENGLVSENIYRSEKSRERIDTFQKLKLEMDVWLAKGFKIQSFNVVTTGESAQVFRYWVILVKDV